jgi:hypothetical protein
VISRARRTRRRRSARSRSSRPHAEAAHRFVRDRARHACDPRGLFQAASDEEVEREDRLQPMAPRHRDRGEVVHRDHRRTRHVSGSVPCGPHSTSRVDARQLPLLPQHAERHWIDAERTALETGAIDDLRMRRDERRRIDVEPPRDLRRVHADAGAVADQRAAVDEKSFAQKCSRVESHRHPERVAWKKQ